ncbi:MAG: permease [Hydrogenobaculum sp.]|nr:MAG: permease [Hydrogenobaculum sp.]
MRIFLFFLKGLLVNVYFYTVVICFIFFSVESFSLVYMLSYVNILTALGFLASWFSYYFIYFLPLGVMLSVFSFFYKLFSQNKIQAFYIFGVSPFYVLRQSLYVIAIPLSIGFLFSFFITNEDITYAKNYLVEEFAKRVIESIPPKTFEHIEGYAIYFDNKSKDSFQNMFVSENGRYIYMKKAYYKDGILYAKDGEVISEENSKDYIVDFKSLKIQIYKLTSSTLSKRIVKKDILFDVLNILLTPFFILLGFYFISNIKMSSGIFYTFLAFFIIIHEAIITVIKTFILKS